MLLSDSGAQSLHGRGTRVWKVVRVKDGEAVGDPVVLKDSWVDLDRPREGAILQEVCGMAASEPADKTLSDALLTVECYGDVVIDGDGDQCIDRTTRMNLSDLPTHGSDTDTAVTKLLLHRHHKVHHRVVFKEICQTIQQLASFHDKFRVLGQTSIKLDNLALIQLVGYIPCYRNSRRFWEATLYPGGI
ncbi:hypothetical protein PHLCEN_2v8107 [Hermanssonia centrifuga]|uniref:Fungal-type protein kinase domain-containing protein n=1 Tax=Hermanssonia centrifuga TaxID=98765 RepID=A0A2R6NUL5_9APHY|nr:hypothetical protein PHLCEN_2v8107 [Hermanssonia centrifuga]